ncbi:MAG: neutral zinc metallopeptidase [Methylococcaceae bacterium]|jgi:predicted metalloprotease|nr:neutral zinc metallopeptidase [Methylococcaceae bacterium]
MLFRRGRESDNVEDRRGQSPRGGFLGGGRGIGIGTLLLLLAGAYFGIDPRIILTLVGGAGQPQQTSAPAQKPPADDAQSRFVSMVLADTEDTWTELFKRAGLRYQDPKLVLFSGATPTPCGMGQSAMGPFYCPPDQKVYIDLRFYDDLKRRFGAPGDFAQAYVVAHEIGHHVQNLLGIADKVSAAQRRMGQAEANQLSVRMELQADCLAGVWANHAHQTRQILEQGDVEEGLRAASAIGDDQIQRRTQGYVVPDGFTHGTSAQRVEWFRRGLSMGDMNACDTFSSNRI